MKSKIMPHSRTRVIFLSSLLLVSGLLMMRAAHAEYYIVYPDNEMVVSCNYGCAQTCFQPCYQLPVVQYLHYSSPHRHNYKASGEEASYAWIGDP